MTTGTQNITYQTALAYDCDRNQACVLQWEKVAGEITMKPYYMAFENYSAPNGEQINDHLLKAELWIIFHHRKPFDEIFFQPHSDSTNVNHIFAFAVRDRHVFPMWEPETVVAKQTKAGSEGVAYTANAAMIETCMASPHAELSRDLLTLSRRGLRDFLIRPASKTPS